MLVAYAPPTWSPDGERIAFLGKLRDPASGKFPSEYSVFTIGPNGANLQRISGTLGLPSWSPDGEHIALVDWHDGGGKAIFTIAPDGSDKRMVTTVPGTAARGQRPSWTRDGSQIRFFTSIGAGRIAPAIVNADGTGRMVLATFGRSSTDTQSHSWDEIPRAAGLVGAWSPDGERLASFGQDRHENTVIYTVNPDGSDLRILARASGESLIAEDTLWEDGASSTPACADGILVASPEDNPGLVQDCVTLLTARDVLTGAGGGPVLNWNPGVDMGSWDGVETGGDPQRVQGLTLPAFGLEGAIPREVGNLTSLTQLELNNNDLGGTIPPELGKLTNLRVLDLSANRLTGYLPPELGNLQKLGELRLGSNSLVGRIPSALGGLSQLWFLGLGQNNFTGAIPDDLTRLANLKLLDLSSNRLTGSVPTGPGYLPEPVFWYLIFWYLSPDLLAGAVPTEPGTLPELVFLDISNTRLSGCLPRWTPESTVTRGLQMERCAEDAPAPVADAPCGDEGAEVDPCEPRDVSQTRLFSVGPPATTAFSLRPEHTVELVLESGLGLLGASPVHLAVRGTWRPDSVRCSWRGIARTQEQRGNAIRAWLNLDPTAAIPDTAFLEALFTATFNVLDPRFRETGKSNFLSIARGGISNEYQFLTCYSEISIGEYLLGSGPTTLTVAFDRRGEARSYDLFLREHEEGSFGNGPVPS